MLNNVSIEEKDVQCLFGGNAVCERCHSRRPGSNTDAAAQTFSDYSKVYYFTDRADGEDYLDDVIIPAASSEGIFSDSVFFYDWSGNSETFTYYLEDFAGSEEMNNVSDALVIFDVQKLT